MLTCVLCVGVAGLFYGLFVLFCPSGTHFTCRDSCVLCVTGRGARESRVLRLRAVVARRTREYPSVCACVLSFRVFGLASVSFAF